MFKFIIEIDEDYFEEREYPEEHKKRILNKISELCNINKNLDEDFNLKKSEKSMSDFYSNEAGIDAGMNLLPSNKEKTCCWSCLKVLIKDQSIEKFYDEKIIKLKVVKNIIF